MHHFLGTPRPRSPGTAPGVDPNCHRRRPTPPRPDNPRRLPRKGPRGVPRGLGHPGMGPRRRSRRRRERGSAAATAAAAGKREARSLPQGRGNLPTVPAAPCRCFSSEKRKIGTTEKRQTPGRVRCLVGVPGGGWGAEQRCSVSAQPRCHVPPRAAEPRRVKPSPGAATCREGSRATGNGRTGRGQAGPAPRPPPAPRVPGSAAPIPACPPKR